MGSQTSELTADQKIAAVTAILDSVNAMTELDDREREFVRHAATVTFAGKDDEGLRVALDTIGWKYAAKVDRVVDAARRAAVGVVRQDRIATLRAEGKQPCSRCHATGTYINGGECYGCYGRGYKL